MRYITHEWMDEQYRHTLHTMSSKIKIKIVNKNDCHLVYILH